MKQIIIYIIGIMIVCVIGGFVAFELKKLKNGDEELRKFLDTLKNELVMCIVNQISNINLNIFKSEESMLEFEETFLGGIYSSSLEIITRELESRKSKMPITYLIVKQTLTEDKIKAYLNTLISDADIQTKISELYNTLLSSKYKEIEEADRELEKEQEIYNNGLDDSQESDIVLNTDIDPERGLAKEEQIIPQTDEGTMFVDTDIDEEVSNAEYSSYLAVANKGLFDVSEGKKLHNEALKKV